MGTLKGARYRYITCAKLVKKNKIFVFLTKTMTVLEHFCWSEYIHKSGEICGYTKICGYIKCIPIKLLFLLSCRFDRDPVDAENIIRNFIRHRSYF